MAQKLVHIQGSVVWHSYHNPKSDKWIGICDSLKLTAQGDTWNDLYEVIRDSITGLLRELVVTQDFNRFLRDRGWKLKLPLPSFRRPSDLEFDIPIELLQERYGSKAELYQQN